VNTLQLTAFISAYRRCSSFNKYIKGIAQPLLFWTHPTISCTR